MGVGKSRVFDGVVNQWPGFDLMLFDCQENLPMLGVSSADTEVPSWNSDPEYKMISEAFFFAEQHLQDHGCIVVFHSWSMDAKSTIAGLCDGYPVMVKKKEWMGMNRVHLTSPIDQNNTV
jgi:hypothetical protein